MNEWLKENIITIIIYAVGVVIAFTTLSGRVSAVEKDHNLIHNRLEKIEELTERLIVIEERTSNSTSDINEIKEDIKDLKKHFNIQ